MKKFSKKKVAIVYDRVNKWGGAERVLLVLHKMYPKAPLYTSVYDKKSAPWAKVFPKIKTSFLQKIPFAINNHEFLAMLMPMAFELFDFSDFDIVISVTSEAAKGIKTNGKTTHICYCLTPTRYLWSGYKDYFKNFIFRVFSYPFIYILRRWDITAAKRPNVMVAISIEVQKRIAKYYGRKSLVVYPPVNISKVSKTVRTQGIKLQKNKYYLIVSRLDYGYKKVGLAIDTFNDLGTPLVIVGGGRQQGQLKSISKSNIKFVGKVNESELIKFYQNAKALIMPQEEDFGIVSVEAQSYGIPVIAYKHGGVKDTVQDGIHGVLFKNQSVKSLKNAILRFENLHFKAKNLINNSKKFSEEKFRQNFDRIVFNATNK